MHMQLGPWLGPLDSQCVGHKTKQIQSPNNPRVHHFARSLVCNIQPPCCPTTLLATGVQDC
jgi:hypothetical protein